jgi:hypothetical protein
MAWYSVEITKLAICNTDVGSVNVAVDDPGNLAVRHLFFPAFVRHIHQLGQRSIFEKKNAFIFIQKLKIQGTLVKVCQLHGAKVVT